MQRAKLIKSIEIIFFLIAGIIIFDFLVSIESEILEIKTDRQQYYNAAKNQHYSFQAFTPAHDFYIDEEFANKIETDQKISYKVSFFFDEINGYSLLKENNYNTYSLRLVFGLLYPLFFLSLHS